MKTVKFFLFVACTTLFLTACSDNLSNSKAEKIINECFKQMPQLGLVNIEYGKDISIDSLELENYKKLEQQGYITLEKQAKSSIYSTRSYYTVGLNDKMKPFIEETKKGIFGSTLAQVRMYEYKLDKVESVHEMPSTNTAEVKMQLIKADKTPFIIFDKDKSEFVIKKVGFTKTTKGWEFCD
ncbi:hypothetical protein [Myroides sp. LJL119]